MEQLELYFYRQININEDELNTNQSNKRIFNLSINNFKKQLKTQRKNNGEFFTKNNNLLKEIEFNINLNKEKFFLVDPSCGNGDILLHLIKKYIVHQRKKGLLDSIIVNNIFRNFYGFDINYSSCLITKERIYTLLKKYFDKSDVDKYKFNELNIYSFDFTLKENIEKYSDFFDYVIGNPPFITYYGKHSKPLSQNRKKYYILNYEFLTKKNKDNRLNSSMFFIENGLNILKSNGLLTYILDISFFEPPYEQIREYIKKYNILRLEDNIKGFNDVYSGQIILSVSKSRNKENFILWKDFETGEILKIQADEFDFKKPLLEKDKNIMYKIENNSKPLRYYFENKEIRTCAVLTGRTDDFVFEKVKLNSRNNFYPFLEGAKGLPERFIINIPNDRFLEYDYEKQLKISEEFKVELEKKGIKNKKRIGLGDEQAYKNPKIFIRQSAKKIISAYSEKPMSANNSIYVVFKKIVSNENKKFLKYLCCLLNSEILTFYAIKKNIIRLNKGKIPQIRLSDLYKIPIKICEKEKMNLIIKLGFEDKDYNRLNKEIANIYGINDSELIYITDHNKIVEGIK